MRILVTGGTGFVGSNLCRHFTALGHTVIIFDGRKTCDLTAERSTVKSITFELPDLVVHAAGFKDVTACENAPSLAAENIAMARNVAAACCALGCKMVLISTDLVFDGTRGDYAETDKPSPSTAYGWSKLHSEMVMHSDSIILRTGGLYDNKSPLLMWLCNRLRAGLETPAYADAINTPTYIGGVAQTITRLTRDAFSGVVHVADKTKVDRFEFFTMIAERFGFDKRLIVSTSGERKIQPTNASLRSIYHRPEAISLGAGLELVTET